VLPWGRDLPGVYAFFNGLHIATAWIFSAIIIGHVGAAAKHWLVDGDGVMKRIWPKFP
jgi:cytochrome b561